MKRGTSDPRVVAEGTIAYLITLDDGFRDSLYRDSESNGGKVTDYEKAVMQRVGKVGPGYCGRGRSTFSIRSQSTKPWSTCGHTTRISICLPITMQLSTACGGRPNQFFKPSRMKIRHL